MNIRHIATATLLAVALFFLAGCPSAAPDMPSRSMVWITDNGNDIIFHGYRGTEPPDGAVYPALCISASKDGRPFEDYSVYFHDNYGDEDYRSVAVITGTSGDPYMLSVNNVTFTLSLYRTMSDAPITLVDDEGYINHGPSAPRWKSVCFDFGTLTVTPDVEPDG